MSRDSFNHSGVERTASQHSSAPKSPWFLRIRGVLAITLALVVGSWLALRAGVFGKGLGHRVLSADECRSGVMLSVSGGPRLFVGGICSEDCLRDDDCPSNYRCFEHRCAPKGLGRLGDECQTPWDCTDLACLVSSPRDPTAPFGMSVESMSRGKAFCSRRCSSDRPCPDGFSCRLVESKPMCVEGPEQSLPEMLDALRQLQSLSSAAPQDADPSPEPSAIGRTEH